MNDQTHCPGCGLHKHALSIIAHNPDGGWTCEKCQKRAALKANPPAPPAGTPQALTTAACPATNGSHAGCETCGGYGVVRVPVESLKVYDPPASRVLTEG